MTDLSRDISRYTADAIRGQDRGYVAYHAPRYAYVLRLLESLGVGPGTRLLDIGPGMLTELMHHRFGAPVDSLGFGPDRDTPRGRHYEFDLNRSQHEAQWRRDLPRYDVVMMGEVIEHLYTAPQLVLAFIRTLVADGGRLIVQTPNAASWQRRVKLALGRNPYEMIRVDPTDPGHFREYTIKELRRLAEGAGFEVERWNTSWYFDARYERHGFGRESPRPVMGAVKNLLYPLAPKRLREGITMVLRRA
jgi:2-polyprenyl-3-methyl-5-hydroxy-6-metoxy-1,4-benzoquinol methylase